MLKEQSTYLNTEYAKFFLLHPLLLLVSDVTAGIITRELWKTSQKFSPPAIIITMALHVRISPEG
jgi:hypothetical protein